MKKPISIALVAACSLAGAAAQAQPQNIYARIDTGGSFSTNAGKDVAVKTLAALVNAYYDLPSFAGFTPYVGGGVGVARNEVGTTTLSLNSNGATVATLSGNTTTQFAWQASAGVAYSILPAVALDFGYRYFDAGEGRSGTTVTTALGSASFPVQRGNIHAHEVQAGIRVGF